MPTTAHAYHHLSKFLYIKSVQLLSLYNALNLRLMAPRTEIVPRRSGRKRKSEGEPPDAPTKRRQQDAKHSPVKPREDSRTRPKRSKNSEQTDDSFATKPDSSDEARCVDVVDLTGESEAEAVPPKVSQKNRDRKSTEKRLKM